MREISKPTLAVYAAAVVAVVLIGARWLHSPPAAGPAGRPGSRFTSSARSAAAALPAGAAANGPILVDVAGAVSHPGVYRLAGSARVYEAIGRAGGLRHDADRLAVNLAARLADGQQVVVPARGRAAPGQAGAGAGSVGGAGTPGPVSINAASAAQLEALDGVGPATAQRIVAYREQHGGFRSLQELDQVGGIGPKRLAALLPQLTL